MVHCSSSYECLYKNVLLSSQHTFSQPVTTTYMSTTSSLLTIFSSYQSNDITSSTLTIMDGSNIREGREATLGQLSNVNSPLLGSTSGPNNARSTPSASAQPQRQRTPSSTQPGHKRQNTSYPELPPIPEDTLVIPKSSLNLSTLTQGSALLPTVPENAPPLFTCKVLEDWRCPPDGLVALRKSFGSTQYDNYESMSVLQGQEGFIVKDLMYGDSQNNG